MIELLVMAISAGWIGCVIGYIAAYRRYAPTEVATRYMPEEELSAEDTEWANTPKAED